MLVHRLEEIESRDGPFNGGIDELLMDDALIAHVHSHLVDPVREAGLVLAGREHWRFAFVSVDQALDVMTWEGIRTLSQYDCVLIPYLVRDYELVCGQVWFDPTTAQRLA